MTQIANLGAQADSAAPGRPRIYVACLAAYNNGCLHGRWIDATTPEAIMEKVRAMLAASPVPQAEEWAIHDYEGFEGARISEYASFETVCALAAFIGEHGALGAELYSHFGDDLEEARAAFDDYAGEFNAAADFAEDIVRESGTLIPKTLEFYIDWEALARDMEMSGEILVIRTGFEETHIFWRR
ncbi:MAG: antirestriction protein ArdA [Parvularculaceae bacterium]